MYNHFKLQHSINIAIKNERKFDCKDCGRTFDSRLSLAVHHQRTKRIHCVRQFECYLCKGNSARLGSLKTHIKTIHCGGKVNTRDHDLQT